MAVDAGTIYGEVRIKTDRLNDDARKVNDTINGVGKSSGKTTTGMQKSWAKTFTSVAGAAGAFALISSAVKTAAKTFSSFEQQMANVQSVARGTPAEFDKLKKAAQDAGEKTRFSATQAADALYNLASAGFSASQSTEALSGVLDLAAATGSDLAASSAAITSTLSQYGLAAEEAGDVSNVFAAAIANSLATLPKLQASLSKVGPIAGKLGISLEETAGALQSLYNGGIKGEEAGTALKNVLSSLANEADPAVQKLEALGISFADVDPAANSLAEIIGRLEEANLSAGQAFNVFGKEAGSPLLTILGEGKKGFQELTAAVTGTNAAATAVAIQNDTLKGSQDKLNSSSEALFISIGEGLEPTLNSITKALTQFVQFVNKVPAPLKGATVAAAAAAAGVGVLGTALSAMGVAVGAALGPIALVVGAIAAIGVGIDTVAKNQRELREEKIAEQFRSIGHSTGLSRDEIEKMSNALADARKSGKSIGEITKLAAELGAQSGKTAEEVLKIADQFQNVSAAADLTGGNILDIQKALKKAVASGKNIHELTKLAEGLGGEYGKTADEILQIAGANEKMTKAGRKALSFAREFNSEQIAQAEARQIAQEKELESRYGYLRKIYALEKKEEEEAKLRAEERELAATKKADKDKKLIEFRVQALDKTTKQMSILNAKRKDGIITENEYQDAVVSAYKTEINALYDRGYALDQDSIGSRRLAELNGLIAESEKSLTTEVEKNTDALTDNALAGGRAADALRGVKDESEEAEEAVKGFTDKQKQAFSDVAKVIGVIGSALSSIGEIAKNNADNQIEENDRVLDAKLAKEDEALQYELERAGLLEETKLEGLEREADAAQAAADRVTDANQKRVLQETADEKKAELERFKLISESEKKKQKLKEDNAKLNKKLAYEAAFVQWTLQVTNGIANAAQAILAAATLIPPNPFAIGAAVGLGIFQNAVIASSVPKKPDFQTGGIVIPKSGGADVRVAENGHSEALFNTGPSGQAFQKQMAGHIAEELRKGQSTGRNDAQGRGVVNIQLTIDGRVLAEASAPYYNGGIVRLEVAE